MRRLNIFKRDNNTKYFQSVANVRHKKQIIYSFENDDGTHIEEADLKRHITKYYNGLFRKPEQNIISLEEPLTHNIPQVLDIENAILAAPFTVDGVREAIFHMEHNKALGPDGFLAEFYQGFWK